MGRATVNFDHLVSLGESKGSTIPSFGGVPQSYLLPQIPRFPTHCWGYLIQQHSLYSSYLVSNIWYPEPYRILGNSSMLNTRIEKELNALESMASGS